MHKVTTQQKFQGPLVDSGIQSVDCMALNNKHKFRVSIDTQN